MARLIDADAFTERFKKAKTLCAVFSPEMREVLLGLYDEFIEEIGNQPTIDAVEVVHGRWIVDESGVIICSECGAEHEWQDYRASFCEDCGAKMDGGKDNG